MPKTMGRISYALNPYCNSTKAQSKDYRQFIKIFVCPIIRYVGERGAFAYMQFRKSTKMDVCSFYGL